MSVSSIPTREEFAQSFQAIADAISKMEESDYLRMWDRVQLLLKMSKTVSHEITLVPVSKNELVELVDTINSDFGHDYGIDEGLAALEKLRELVK